MVGVYLVLVEAAKRWWTRPDAPPHTGVPADLSRRFVRRRAARFSAGPAPQPSGAPERRRQKDRPDRSVGP
jgi:hypothetical protein